MTSRARRPSQTSRSRTSAPTILRDPTLQPRTTGLIAHQAERLSRIRSHRVRRHHNMASRNRRRSRPWNATPGVPLRDRSTTPQAIRDCRRFRKRSQPIARVHRDRPLPRNLRCHRRARCRLGRPARRCHFRDARRLLRFNRHPEVRHKAHQPARVGRFPCPPMAAQFRRHRQGARFLGICRVRAPLAGNRRRSRFPDRRCRQGCAQARLEPCRVRHR